MIKTEEISVLMISLDPDLISDKITSDVLERHQLYAQQVKSLDIVVIGGNQQNVKNFHHLNIYATGSKGLMGFFRALSLGAKICRSSQIQLIDCQDPHMTGLIGWLLKLRFKIPLEVHCHGDFIANDHWRREQSKNSFYAVLQKFILRRSDAVRVVSPLIAEKIKNQNLTAGLLVVINTPVNTDQFTQRPVLDHPNEFVILSNARLVAAKNLFFILEVIKELSRRYTDIHYRIVGDGPLRPELEQRIIELGLQAQIVFAGKMSPEQLAEEYSRADVLLLLSTNESLGKVIIEAGLMGVPTVASATLGAQTIIVPEVTGLIVPINDLSASVSALVKLHDDSGLRRQLGAKAAIQYRQRFDRQRSISAIIELWQQLANKQSQ